MEDVPAQKLSQWTPLFECIAWAFAVGAAIAGEGMYVDIRDNVSEVLGDHWYFLRSNIWWMPYYAVLISAPLLVICAVRRAVAAFVRRMMSRKGRVAADGHRAGDRSHPYTSTFLALYASAAAVASAVHTVVVNCIWSTLCARGEWGGTLLVSPLFFGVPLGLMMLRRTLWSALRRGLVAGK
jgi:hypothetical protein